MRQRRILVVDDDQGIRDVVEMILSSEGYEVTLAPDGAVGLALAQQAPPDAILLDMAMPGVNGWQFTETYRRGPAPHAPIIVMTAARNAVLRAMSVAADAYLAKPFDLDSLLDIVDQFAGLPKRSPDPPPG